MNLQAICNSNHEFIWFDMSSVGSTHDATAAAMTALAEKLEGGHLPAHFWLAGDDAYSATVEQVVTPYPGRNLQAHRDNFNFWLSNSRITIECAFGIFVNRWGCLWRRLDTHLVTTGKIVRACLVLHNFCTRAAVPLLHMGALPPPPPDALDRDMPGNPNPIFQSDINAHAGVPFRPGPVSYTHLTLPTICSV